MLAGISIQSLRDRKVTTPWSVPADTNREDRKTRYHVYLIANGDGDGLSEISILPGPIDALDDCWNLTIGVNERPGAYSELAEFLATRNINILHARSATKHHAKSHTLQLLLDCKGYASSIDGNINDRRADAAARLFELEWELYSAFCDTIVMTLGAPLLFVSRNEGLWTQTKRFIGSGGQNVFDAVVVAENGQLEIPQAFLQRIFREYQKRYDLPEELSNEPIGLLSLDSDFLFDVFVFYPNSGALQCTVEFDNCAGGIAGATRFINDAGFNILMSKAWVLSEGSRTSIWMLIHDNEFTAFKRKHQKMAVQNLQARFGELEQTDWFKDFSPSFDVWEPTGDGE